MADYIVEKALPEFTNQYVIKYFKDAEAADGATVSVVDRTEIVTNDGLKEKLAGFDTQVAAIQAEKDKTLALVAEIKELG